MRMGLYRAIKPAAMAFVLLAPVCFAQKSQIESGARTAIDSGNQAWVDGMKHGNPIQIAETYSENAVDCNPNGECSRGRSAIEQHFKDVSRTLGPAQDAFAHTTGAVQEGEVVYEWGRAEAGFASGRRMERYLTVWRREPDGRWRIFRNMVIAEERR